MANLIQIKRASDFDTSEDPGATTLAEGELAWNNKGKKLWMGRKIATTGTTHELYRVDKSVLGTTNQISVSEGAESFTVSLPGQVNLSDLTISGTLLVNGTTTTVNSTVVTVDDPIFTLGGDGDGVDDDKDRGIEFKWHNGSAAKKGFFGRNDNTGRFAYIADATNSSEVFSGALGDAEFTTVYANLTGNVTGNLTGTVTGNATNVTGTVAIANGGTGATTVSGARSALGLTIGGDVQAADGDLTAIAALNAHNGNFIVGNGSAWVAESGSTARTSLGLGTSAVLNTAAVSDGATTLSTGDQIHTFVTTVTIDGGTF